MTKANEKPFETPAEQLRHFPEVSGNTINGLGEAGRRRPSPIYWRRAETIAHGPLMNYMIGKFQSVGVLREIYDRRENREPRKLVPVAAEQAGDTAENWTRAVKDFALANEADLVGITALDPLWAYDDSEENLPWVVVLAFEMDYQRLADQPVSDDNPASAIEVAVQYNRGARATSKLANWIREQGWRAERHAGPWAGGLTLIPPALACGFGELGKHGSIINRTYGSSFRLAGVVTDLPLNPDPAQEFGADDFCTSCRVCTDACPPDAIFREKQTVRGVSKWYVDFDKCVGYFNETHGCGICVAVCPWSRPGTAPRLAERMTRRRARKAAE